VTKLVGHTSYVLATTQVTFEGCSCNFGHRAQVIHTLSPFAWTSMLCLIFRAVLHRWQQLARQWFIWLSMAATCTSMFGFIWQRYFSWHVLYVMPLIRQKDRLIMCSRRASFVWPMLIMVLITHVCRHKSVKQLVHATLHTGCVTCHQLE